MGDIVTKKTSKNLVYASYFVGDNIVLNATQRFENQDSLQSNEAVPITNVDIDILFGPNPIGHSELRPS